MTKEEAAKTLESAISEVEWNYPIDYTVALEMAIAALRAEAEKNEPLTVEELREMDGEPVWVCTMDGKAATWMFAYYDRCENLTDVAGYEDYGSVWLAYRRKPEEEQ